MKPGKCSSGYLYVGLRNHIKTQKNFLIHRLVAQAFLPNPNNYPVINHKDENKLNNNVNNLEFCTQKYNLNYGNHYERISNKLINRKDLLKPVLQYAKTETI